MKFDYTLLTGKIKTVSSFGNVAKMLGISYGTLSSRLRGKPFKTDEILKIAKYLDINLRSSDEMNRYFFNTKCSQNRTA